MLIFEPVNTRCCSIVDFSSLPFLLISVLTKDTGLCDLPLIPGGRRVNARLSHLRTGAKTVCALGRGERERERECIKLLIYDSKLFYFFYANLRCVVQAARKQSDKGSNCFFEICLCFLSRFTTKFRSAAVKVFWLPRRRPVLEWSQWFFVECGIPSILRRHMIQVESSHKCVHIQSVDCSHGGATAIYNVHTPFFISLCRAGYC